jgi:2-polyprenyl-3-methyl-5-hydroxy-6-metoxy-1,4-benzoquinol methylase
MRIPILYKNRAAVKISCPVCSQREDVILYKLWNTLFPVNISFCHSCGFIFQNPRSTEKEWNEYYSEGYYDRFHRPRPVQNFENKGSNSDVGALTFKRIKQYLLINEKCHDITLKGNRVCEIGAGNGDVISSFSGNELCAIEPSEECQDVLKKKGISIVLNSTDQAKNSNYKFEIILMRHVLEHVYYPKNFLKTVRDLLTDKGIMYIAVPNIFVSDRTFTSMFSYPHISYFSVHSLKYLCQSIGYTVLAIKTDVDEIWCIISKSKDIEGSKENPRTNIDLEENIRTTKTFVESEKKFRKLFKYRIKRYISTVIPIKVQQYILENRNR